MKKKRRRLNIKNLLKLLSIPLTVLVLSLVFSSSDNPENEVNPIVSNKLESFFEHKSLSEYILSPSQTAGLDLKKLTDDDYISYKNTEMFEVDLNSYGYLLADLENRDALYACHNNEPIYPASLTKLMTLDVILKHYHENLERTSSFSDSQRNELIAANASLAYLDAEQEYSIRDLLYGLMLPSGADAAVALENLCEQDGINLVDEMNSRAVELGLSQSNFINTTGLHDENHHMSLDDIFKIVWDILKYKEGQSVLSTMEYITEDDKSLTSTLLSLEDIEEVNVRGGKTGFTDEAGENIFVYYFYNEKPYVLILSNAQGNPYAGEYYHFDDVKTIIQSLYSNVTD